MKQAAHRYILTALIAVLGWGMVGIFIRLSTLQSPIVIISLRFLITFFIVLIALLIQRKVKQTFVALVSNKINMLLSLLLFLTYLLGTTAFIFSSIGEITLLISISPFFVILFRKLRGDIITANEYIGTFVAILGVIIILFPQFTDVQNVSSLFGDLLAIAAAALFAAFVMISNEQNHKKQEVNSMSVTLGTCLCGVLIFLYIILFDSKSLNFEDLNSYNIMSIIALGIISTAIPTFGFAYASKKISPLLLSNILLLEPVFAIIFAFLFLSEVPNVFLYPGIVCILIGLLKVSKR